MHLRAIFRRRRILIVGGALAVLISGLYFAGFWTPRSSIYWARPAQTVAFFVASHLPQGSRAGTIRFALSLFPEDTSYAEVTKAAEVLEVEGEREVAATLWLAVAQIDASYGNVANAKERAKHSYALSAKEKAALSLIALNAVTPQEKRKWISEMQVRFPEHAVSHAYSCIDGISSFAAQPPAACARQPWLRMRTEAAVADYVETSREIEQLPSKSAFMIAANSFKINELNAQQRSLTSKYSALSDQIAWYDKYGTWRAAGDAFVEILPIPRGDDTTETFVVREGLCAMPYIRAFCRSKAVIGAFEKVNTERKDAVAAREAMRQEWIKNERSLARARDTIAYWQSTERLSELVSSRDHILPTFKRNVETDIDERYGEVGVALVDAIRAAIGTDRDGRVGLHNDRG